jgi:hypothetical protein
MKEPIPKVESHNKLTETSAFSTLRGAKTAGLHQNSTLDNCYQREKVFTYFPVVIGVGKLKFLILHTF